MKEMIICCPECLKNYNKGVKMMIEQWTCNDLELNKLKCPYCGHIETIEKGEKK